MILQLGLRKTVRLDLLPHSLAVVTGQPLFPEEAGHPHARCGLWWVDEHAGMSRALTPVEPVRIPEDDARAHGLESGILYPVRPPAGRAPESQVRRYRYLCYGWDGDTYLPHSVVHTFAVAEHNQAGHGPFWTLSLHGMEWVLPGFDPSVDPAAGLAVHDVMGG